jgi:beta-galactosidase/beta-glucuronidase
MMKGAGAVFARLMHTPQAPNLLDYLDEKGMMIFSEIPVWGWDDPQKFAGNPLTKQWLREMIERDYNHPCIIGWSCGNELAGHYAYVASMNEYVHRELDPYRLVGYVSNTAGLPGYGPKNDPVSVSDLVMINKYGTPRAFEEVPSLLRERWPDKPVFYSEFGQGQIGASLDAKIPEVEKIWGNISKEPYVIGGALWTFNDYRSGFKGTPPSGNREWGVVDIERRPKAAYWQIRKLFSPVHSLEIKGGAVLLTPRSGAEIPCYTLRGYEIAWKRFDSKGKATGEGRLALPDVAPDSPPWTSPIPEAGEAARVTVSLITPTGYDVADASNPEPPGK